MTGRGHKDVFAEDIVWTGVGEDVCYAQFLLDEGEASSPSVVLARFVAAERIDPHTHGCNYLEYIVEGSQRVGKVNFKAGDVRMVAAGTGYGPIEIGAEGCTVLIVFQDAEKSPPVLLGRGRGPAA
jgi:anti-sigma factor ChrR (cupin superfamily)